MADLKVMNTPTLVQVEPPLCVDLDGTLVKSDTLVDSLVVLVRRHPKKFLSIPIWAVRGRAHLKFKVTSTVALDVENLPYNQALLAYLHHEREAGRRLYLTTGADAELAQRIASHLGIFEEVLASDGKTNLTGKDKLKQLRERCSPQGFDYVGNAMPDLPLLQAARQAMIANPGLRLKGALRLRKVPVNRTFIDRSGRLPAIAKAIRVHQWAKNVLVFLPLLLAHSFRWPRIAASLAAFLCFCLAASSTYIFNDLLDLATDRMHRSKRFRAFAAGDLSVQVGVTISFFFLATSLTLASFLPRSFLLYLLVYLGTTIAYSLVLKRKVLIDVIVLSSLYTIRMLAGAAATHTFVSPWLAAFSIFLFLSLAMVKRFSELHDLDKRGLTPANGRGYLVDDIEQLRAFGTSSAFASIVVFALYISGPDVAALYHHASRMWLVTPLMILWLCRVWLLAARGVLNEDPVVFALTDWRSLLMGVGVLLIALSAL